MQCSLTGIFVRSRMGRASHLVRMDASKSAKRTEVEKTSRTREKGNNTAEMGRLREEGHEKIGGGRKMERRGGR